MTHPVLKLEQDEAHGGTNGPVVIDRRTPASGLTELSSGFVHFASSGPTEPWTLPYEETFYVISGELTLHCEGEVVVGGPGDVLSIEKGATVVYEGTEETRAFFSLVPADWAQRVQS